MEKRINNTINYLKSNLLISFIALIGGAISIFYLELSYIDFLVYLLIIIILLISSLIYGLIELMRMVNEKWF